MRPWSIEDAATADRPSPIASELTAGPRVAREVSDANAQEASLDRKDTEAAHDQFETNVHDLLEAVTVDRRLRGVHEARLQDELEARLIGRSRRQAPVLETSLPPREEDRENRRVTARPKGQNAGQGSRGRGERRPTALSKRTSIDLRSLPTLNRVVLPEGMSAEHDAIVMR